MSKEAISYPGFIGWVDRILSRNGGDRELNELVKALEKHGYRKTPATEDPTEFTPVAGPTPDQFAKEIAYVLGNPGSMYHKPVTDAISSRGYYMPVPVPPSELRMDLQPLPTNLQEVFKVFVDKMLEGLQNGQARINERPTQFRSWLDTSFSADDAMVLVLQNLFKGDFADAANFLMFMDGRNWKVTPEMLHNARCKVALPLPTPLRGMGQKRSNKGFWVQTHGTEIPLEHAGKMKDELFEGKIHWIRAVPGYEDLFNVLALAYDQAARGKGVERHGNGKPFNQQPIMRLAEAFGSGFLLGQASKKLEESTGMGFGRDVKEIFGAIVYSAAAVMHLEKAAKDDAEIDVEEDF